MKPSELAQKAFNLIKSPENWIQGMFARDSKGNWCSVKDSKACKFCSIGALASVGDVNDLSYEAVYSKLSEIAKDMDVRCDSPMSLNDNHTHETVCEMWAKTIDSLKSKGL